MNKNEVEEHFGKQSGSYEAKWCLIYLFILTEF